MPKTKAEILAQAVVTLKATLETYRLEERASRAQAEYLSAYSKQLLSQATTAYLEGEDARAVGLTDSMYKTIVLAQDNETRAMECKARVEQIERNLKSDGGKKLAWQWYTTAGQEEFEGYCDGEASRRDENR